MSPRLRRCLRTCSGAARTRRCFTSCAGRSPTIHGVTRTTFGWLGPAKAKTATLVIYLRALAASGPVNAQLHLDLARNLATLGRHVEARAALAKARRVAEIQRDEESMCVIESFAREWRP